MLRRFVQAICTFRRCSPLSVNGIQRLFVLRPYGNVTIRSFCNTNIPNGHSEEMKKVRDRGREIPQEQRGTHEPGRSRLFRLLKLNAFSEKEIALAHIRLYDAQQECLQVAAEGDTEGSTGTVTSPVTTASANGELLLLARELKLLVVDTVVASNVPAAGFTTSNTVSMDLDPRQVQLLPLPEFSALLRKSGEELDTRVWPIALSFAATGLSIGIIIPILPMLVKEIHISSSVFGLAVSAFGLAKLMGNVPSANWVEQYGRKPVLVGGMVMCAAGLGSIGFSLIPELGAPWLIGCRFVTGLGVAAFTSGAFMYMNDISTSLNRARTMAPVMSAFTAGTAVGPAIGGLAVEHLGIMNTYVTVGSSIALLAALNQAFLHESRPPQPLVARTAATVSTGAGGSFAVAYKEWKELLKIRPIRDIVLLNGCYWVALAGTQLTLLPLFMVAEPLSLNSEHIGIIFSSISVVSVAVAQPTAYLADKWGKVPSMLLGTGLMSLSFFFIPLTSSFEQLIAAVVPLALGSPLLSTVPTAHVSDLTTSEQRAQALALLRTAGDMGLLTGAVSAGIVSQLAGMSNTMQGNASMLAAAAVWYGLRQYTSISTNPITNNKDKSTRQQ